MLPVTTILQRTGIRVTILQMKGPSKVKQLAQNKPASEVMEPEFKSEWATIPNSVNRLERLLEHISHGGCLVTPIVSP